MRAVSRLTAVGCMGMKGENHETPVKAATGFAGTRILCPLSVRGKTVNRDNGEKGETAIGRLVF